MKVDEKIIVDEKIMAELLEQLEVKCETAKMSPKMLAWYKELLVSEGIYTQFVKEREGK